MENLVIQKNQKHIKRGITLISIVIPLVIALLLVMPYKLSMPMEVVYTFPLINGILNTLTSILLVAAVIFVKQGKLELHKKTMLAAVGLGVLFIVFYVLYHASAPSTKYGDANGDMVVDALEKAAVAGSSGIYYFVLLTHIVLAAAVLPFVLMAVYFGLIGKLPNHKKIVRWAFPIWLYVSVTGVVVYLMISPFYPN